MKLTQNFYLSEFQCKDGSITPKEVILRLQKLSIQLQVLRDYLGRPIKINSGYRTIEYNRNIGGVKGSQHTLGNAADITIEGYTPKEVANHIEYLINKGLMLQGGIGVYNTFVHYDIGFNGKRRRW